MYQSLHQIYFILGHANLCMYDTCPNFQDRLKIKNLQGTEVADIMSHHAENL